MWSRRGETLPLFTPDLEGRSCKGMRCGTRNQLPVTTHQLRKYAVDAHAVVCVGVHVRAAVMFHGGSLLTPSALCIVPESLCAKRQSTSNLTFIKKVYIVTWRHS